MKTVETAYTGEGERAPVDDDEDHVRGEEDALVTETEQGDEQRPQPRAKEETEAQGVMKRAQERDEPATLSEGKGKGVDVEEHAGLVRDDREGMEAE